MQTLLVFLSEPFENCDSAQTCYTMRCNCDPQSTEDIHHLWLDLVHPPCLHRRPLHLFTQFPTKFLPQLGALLCPRMKADAGLPPASPSSLLLLFLSMLSCLRPLLELRLWTSEVTGLSTGVWFLLCLKSQREKTKRLIGSRRVCTRFQLSPLPRWKFISSREGITISIVSDFKNSRCLSRWAQNVNQ